MTSASFTPAIQFPLRLQSHENHLHSPAGYVK